MKPFRFLLTLASVLAMGTVMASGLGTGLLATSAIVGLSGLGVGLAGLPAGSMFDIVVNVDVNGIIAESTTYFRPGGQAEDQIQQTIKDKRDLPGVANLRLVDGDIVELSEAEISDVIQGFKHQFSPKGTVNMTPVPFRLRNIKIDLSLYPDKIKSTYYGFLAGMPEGDRKNWPIVRWIWEVLVAPKWGANQALIDWAGVYAAPSNDTTAGPTLGSYDGIKKIVQDGLTAGSMNELTLTKSLLNPVETFEAFEEINDQLDQAYQEEEMVYLCSERIQKYYLRDRRNSHGNDMDYLSKLQQGTFTPTIDFRENHVIQKMAGIGRNNDHGWVIVTPKRNLLLGRRNNSYNFHMESDKRAVALMADWYEGVGFGLAEEVFVVRPSEESSS
jgi:hypothetical protein